MPSIGRGFPDEDDADFRARSAVIATEGIKPEEANSAHQLAEKYNIAPALVWQTRDELDNRERITKAGKGIDDATPWMKEWLADQGNSAAVGTSGSAFNALDGAVDKMRTGRDFSKPERYARVAAGNLAGVVGSTIEQGAGLPMLAVRTLNRAIMPVFQAVGASEEFVQGMTDPQLGENYIANFGKLINQFSSALTSELGEQSFDEKTLGALSQVAAMISLGIVSRGVGAASGALQAMQGQEDDMAAAGVDPTSLQADTAKILSGTAGFVLNRWSLDKYLDKLPYARTAVGRILGGFKTEASQEIAEQITNNLIAQSIYDENRDLFNGAMEAGTVGGAAGAIMSLVLGRKARIQHNALDEVHEWHVRQTKPGEEGTPPPLAPSVINSAVKNVFYGPDGSFGSPHLSGKTLQALFSEDDRKPYGLDDAKLAGFIRAGQPVALPMDFFTQEIVRKNRIPEVKPDLRFGHDGFTIAQLDQQEADYEAWKRVPDEQKVTPDPAPGFTRLYRVEVPGRDKEKVTTPAHRLPPGTLEARGRWFVDDFEKVPTYEAMYGTDELGLEVKTSTTFVDVLTHDLERHRVSNIAGDAVTRPQEFALDKNAEFFVTPDMAKKRKRLITAKNKDEEVDEEVDEDENEGLTQEEVEARDEKREKRLVSQAERNLAHAGATFSAQSYGMLGLLGEYRNLAMNPAQALHHLTVLQAASKKHQERIAKAIAKNQIAYNTQVWSDDYKDALREARERVSNMNDYAAWEYVQTAQLDRRELKKLLPEGSTLQNLPRRADGSRIYGEKDVPGLLPSIVAKDMGYGNVVELLQGLRNAHDIPAETRATEMALDVVRKKHGDIMRETELLQLVAEESSTWDDADNILLDEMAAVAGDKAAGRTTAALMKADAMKVLDATLISDINPKRYLDKTQAAMAQLRHFLKGVSVKNEGFMPADRITASELMTMHLQNRYMAREAFRLEREYKGEFGYVTGWLISRDRPDHDPRAVEAIRELLGTYGENPKAQFKNLPLADWKNLHETVKFLDTQGILGKQHESANAAVRLDAVIGEALAVSTPLPNAPALKPGELPSYDDNKGFKSKLLTFWSNLQMVESIALQLDGGKIAGPWHGLLIKPARDAANMEDRLLKKDLAPVIKLLFSTLDKNPAKWAEEINVPSLGQKFKRSELFMMLLNFGNASNIRKLTDGANRAKQEGGIEWNVVNVTEAINLLSKEEAELANKFWAISEGSRDTMATIYAREHGRAPKMVEAVPITLENGAVLTGGYFHLTYDRARLPAAERVMNAAEAMNGPRIQSVVEHGFVHYRTDYQAPLSLDIHSLPSAYAEVIHFISHYQMVRDSLKLIARGEVAQHIQQKMGPAAFENINDWLNVLANRRNAAITQDTWNPWYERLRSNATYAVLGFSYSSGVSQFLGLTSSVTVLGREPGGGFSGKKGRGYLKAALDLYASDPRGTLEAVYKSSDFMKFRQDHITQEMSEQLTELEGKSGKLNKVKRASLMFMAKAQFYGVDVPTWVAATNKAVAENRTPADAATLADSVVKMSQGGGRQMDLSQIQRQPGPMRILTLFSTWPVIYANMMVDNYVGFRDSKLSRKEKVKQIADQLQWAWLFPAIADSLLRMDFPDDEKEPVEDWLLNRVGWYPLTQLPLVGSAFKQMFSGRQPTAGGAAQIHLEAIGKVFHGIRDPLDEWGDIDPKSLRDIAIGAGVARGLPGMVQLNRTWRWAESEDELTPWEILTGPKKK